MATCRPQRTISYRWVGLGVDECAVLANRLNGLETHDSRWGPRTVGWVDIADRATARSIAHVVRDHILGQSRGLWLSLTTECESGDVLIPRYADPLVGLPDSGVDFSFTLLGERRASSDFRGLESGRPGNSFFLLGSTPLVAAGGIKPPDSTGLGDPITSGPSHARWVGYPIVSARDAIEWVRKNGVQESLVPVSLLCLVETSGDNGGLVLPPEMIQLGSALGANWRFRVAWVSD